MDAAWIEETDRLDKMLHRIGVPSNVRHTAIEEIANILIEASKAKRDRRQLVFEAVARCGNVRDAAKEEGWSHETFYRVLRTKSQTPVTG